MVGKSFTLVESFFGSFGGTYRQVTALALILVSCQIGSFFDR